MSCTATRSGTEYTSGATCGRGKPRSHHIAVSRVSTSARANGVTSDKVVAPIGQADQLARWYASARDSTATSASYVSVPKARNPLAIKTPSSNTKRSSGHANSSEVVGTRVKSMGERGRRRLSKVSSRNVVCGHSVASTLIFMIRSISR